MKSIKYIFFLYYIGVSGRFLRIPRVYNKCMHDTAAIYKYLS